MFREKYPLTENSSHKVYDAKHDTNFTTMG